MLAGLLIQLVIQITLSNENYIGVRAQITRDRHENMANGARIRLGVLIALEIKQGFMYWGSVVRDCQDVILNVALSGEERLLHGAGLNTAFKVELSRLLLFGGFGDHEFEYSTDVNALDAVIVYFVSDFFRTPF